MTAKSGLYGSVVITAVGTVAGTAAIVGIGEWSLDLGMDTPETTAFGDTWKQFIAGLREYSGSFAGRGDTDSSNATIRNAMLGGSAISLRLYDAAATYWDCGTVLLNSGNPQTSVDGVQEDSWDFQGSNALTYV